MTSQCPREHIASDDQLVKIEQLIQTYATMLTERLKEIHQIKLTAATTLIPPHLIVVHLQLQHLETPNQVSSITHINLHENAVIQLDKAVDRVIDKLFEHIQQNLPKDWILCFHCGKTEHH